jgi:hypothetical protein
MNMGYIVTTARVTDPKGGVHNEGPTGLMQLAENEDVEMANEDVPIGPTWLGEMKSPMGLSGETAAPPWGTGT